jgi:Tfp pilus assembly protein PilF
MAFRWLARSSWKAAAGCVLAAMLGGCVTGPTPKDHRQAQIQYDLGVNELRAGKITEALKIFLEVVKLNPEFPEAENALGLSFHMLGNNEQALAHYQRALELKKDYSEVLNNMARIHISEGRFRNAIPLLRKALDDVFLPERYLAESNLGWALFQIGKEKEGFRHVRNALALNEKYCVGYEYMGLMFQARKNFKDAIREFDELVERCPNYPQGYRSLGKVLLMAGEVERGCKALDSCREHSRMTTVGNECDRLFRKSCADHPSKPTGNDSGRGSAGG